jgi:DNA-binding GntR family transcriptional regulator
VVTDAPTVSSAERAYLFTKAQIIRGVLPGGGLISEGQICDELGISRTPVHEAFLRLAAEHLLVLSSRKGAVVAPMSPSEGEDVLEMREAIERAAADRLIRAGGPAPEVAARLHLLLERQQAALEADDVDEFVDADDEFHSGVVAASGNGIAVHLWGLLRDRQQRMRSQLLRMRPDRLPAALDDHRQLLDRLVAADLAGFEAVLTTHLERHRGAL